MKLLLVLLSIAVGAGAYWFVLVYFSPLTPRAESRLSDIIMLVQYGLAVVGWIYTLRENKRLHIEVKALKEKLQAAGLSTEHKQR
jgi:uncharacterized membrane protein YciS (DUF1049 family)